MRLIGGNISDAPVKAIGDGSAFAVGGGGGSATPLLASFANPEGTTPWRKCPSGWHEPDPRGAHQTTGNTTYHAYMGIGVEIEKLADDIHIIVWRSGRSATGGVYTDLATGTDGEVKAAIITFDSSGDPTFGAMQELTDFTTRPSGNVHVRRVSSTRCLIVSNADVAGNQYVEIGTYDVSGDTISLMSGCSIQAIGPASTSDTLYNYDSAYFGIHVLDSTRALVYISDYYFGGAGTNGGLIYGIKFTPTQAIGARYTVGVPSGTADNGYTLNVGMFRAFKQFLPDPDGNDKVWFQDSAAWWSISYSSASTPAVPACTLEVSNGYLRVGGNYHGGDTGTYTPGYLVDRVYVPEADRGEYGEQFHIGGYPNASGYYAGKETNDGATIGPIRSTFNLLQYNATHNYAIMQAQSATLVWLDKVGTTNRLISAGTVNESGTPIFATFNYDHTNQILTMGPQLKTVDTTDWPLDDAGTGRWSHTYSGLIRAIKPNDSSKRITYVATAADGAGSDWNGGEGGWTYATVDCLPPE